MSDVVTEALLEMHFHQAIVDRFRRQYGANFLKLLKPSPKQEAWVGFDQGWVRTSLSTSQLFSELQSAILNQATTANNFCFGFFLQFKIVKRMVRTSKLKPAQYTTPYFRSELSVDPNPTTGISQHETLLRLNALAGATVSYACGMLFDIADIWQAPSVDKLRCVDITTSPTGWATNQRHFLAFQTETDPSPFWCSDPAEGKSVSFDEWAFRQDNSSPKKMTGNQLHHFVTMVHDAIRDIGGSRIRALEADCWQRGIDPIPKLMPSSFTIMEFGQ
jgi:hypothetical protein